MRGFRFYAVMPDERKSKSASKRFPHQPWTRAHIKTIAARGQYVECLAIDIESRRERHDGSYDCAGALQAGNDQAVCGSSCSADYLTSRCTSIDEATARKLHPALFSYLEA